jgi:hypothetical protein
MAAAATTGGPSAVAAVADSVPRQAERCLVHQRGGEEVGWPGEPYDARVAGREVLTVAGVRSSASVPLMAAYPGPAESSPGRFGIDPVHPPRA